MHYLARSAWSTYRREGVAIAPPPLTVSLSLQGVAGKSLVIVTLGLNLAVRADAPPLLHQQKAAEQVRRSAPVASMFGATVGTVTPSANPCASAIEIRDDHH
jgi:hypothetical protein